MKNNLPFYFNFHYTISDVKRSKVGNIEKHPDAKINWKMNLNDKFIDWDLDRIWVVEKGSGFIHTTLGNFPILEGNAYFIPGASLISTECEDYMEQYYINFFSEYDCLPLHNTFSFKHQINDISFITQLIDIVYNNTYNNNDNIINKFRIDSAMNTILSLFIDKPLKNNEKNPVFESLQHINSNYNQDISITDLANLSHYNTEYFCKLFKKNVGVSPQNFLITKRLNAAKKLLISTSLSIKEIAFRCGYSDPLYFSKLFIKHIKCSPKKYREIFQNIKN